MQDFKVSVATCLKQHIEEMTLEEIAKITYENAMKIFEI